MADHVWTRAKNRELDWLFDDSGRAVRETWVCERCGSKVVARRKSSFILTKHTKAPDFVSEMETLDQVIRQSGIDPDCDTSTVSGVMLS